MGRPRLQVDERQIVALAGVGCSIDEISAETGISARTLKRRFGTVIRNGAKKRDVRLRSAMFKFAMRGNAQLLIFLGKVCLGMKEPADPQVAVNVTQNANLVDGPGVRERLAKMHSLIRAECARQDGNGDQLPGRLDGLSS